jgi:hypothetical protein
MGKNDHDLVVLLQALAALAHNNRTLEAISARLERLEQLLAGEPERPHEAAGCAREIKETLRGVGHRLTTAEVLRELSRRGYKWGESTVKQTLATLVDTDEIDNRQDVNPRGYGLKEWK